MNKVLGWDIGGVNTKAALAVDGRIVAARASAFELQRAPDALAIVLQELAASFGGTLADGSPRHHAVTMTAELSQMFRSKRDGVHFVLDAVTRAFPADDIHVYAVDGRFLSPAQAQAEHVAVAAANWAATARAVARRHPDAILIDTGTTTTDVVAIVGGKVAAVGWNDPDRLASGELVYTGALRTPTEAIASHIWMNGRKYGVSAETFALAGDVHVWRKALSAADYTVPTPDGRPADRQFAGERLRRVICADPELVDEAGVSEIAEALARAQVARIAESIIRVRASRAALKQTVVTGLGAFLGVAAARTVGLDVAFLADDIGADAATYAPAAAVALLLADGAFDDSTVTAPVESGRTQPSVVDLVVKVGGSLLAHPEALNRVMDAVVDASRRHRVLVVPGGGPLADTVRHVDRALHLSADAAHWMAVRAIDQLAEVLADRCAPAAVVTDAYEIREVLRASKVPVLAPHRWLRDADALPHSWDATSDSVAAWVAGELGARRLVLVKAPGATGDDLVDTHFERARPPGLESHVVAADDAALGPLLDL
jgi:(4-(4-[2-(gamma-L-glutamylamino)ethyl]phenoxymethyl)furan-2-yl)methanamine synthase